LESFGSRQVAHLGKASATRQYEKEGNC